MTEGTIDATRLAWCGSCLGKIKVPRDRVAVACPLCGLTLGNGGDRERLGPIVVPRAGRETCWTALVSERRLPAEAGATEIRSARLLLVPFWRLVDESKRSLTRPGVVASGADLSPVGLPCLAPRGTAVAGLSVEPCTRSGDAMGRLEAQVGDLAAELVDVTIGPEGWTPGRGFESTAQAPSEPDRPWWRLIYYPVWSFHYVVYNKEHYHVVDATTASPIGPARRLRHGAVAWAMAASMLALFLAMEPFVGAAAALPAWLIGLAAMRLTLLSQRGWSFHSD